MVSSSPTDFDTRIQSLGMSRRTEATHTKMGIKRDESDDLTRKRKSESDTEPTSIPWDDMTDVSIMALRGFLEDLLGVSHQSPATITPILAPSASTHPMTQSARAAKAYHTTGKVVHDKNVKTLPPASSETLPSLSVDAESSVQGNFNDNDKQRMRHHITLLNEAERRGMTHLSLRRQLGFLDSIDEALKGV